MPEQEKPEAKEEQPFFEIKGSKVMVGGVEMDIRDLDPFAEVPEGEGGENIHVEGEEFKKEEEEPEKKEEAESEPETPEKQEEKPEETPPKEPEKTEPDKLKFKLKFRGEESEVELSPEQIANRLQILRSYQENEREFWDERKKVAPFAKIVESDGFKQWLRERREEGEQVPEEQEPSREQETIEYELEKRRDPQIVSQLREWAIDNLTPKQFEILNNNPDVYIKEYDRFVEEAKKAQEPPEKPVQKVDPKVKEQILKSKEVVKERAAVEKPGVQREVDPQAADKRRIKFLEKMMREGNRGQQEDAAEELAYLTLFKPYQK